MLSRILMALIPPIFILYYLYFTTDLPNKHPNGFDRKFLSNSVKMLYMNQLPVEARQIAGIINDTTFLSTDKPSALLISTPPFDAWATYNIPLTITQLSNTDLTFQTKILGSQFHIISGNQASIIRFDKNRKTLQQVDSLGRKFINAIPISSQDYILRQFTDDLKGLQFVKINSQLHKKHTTEHLPIAGQAEWLNTDGQLLYDDYSKVLVFAHYYGNEFITFDTTLHTVKKFNTIDHVPIPSHIIDNQPKLMIIQTACTHMGKLFLASNLKADNEARNTYIKNIPIDRYDLKTGSYLDSFYLPAVKGSLIKSLMFSANKLIVLYHNNQVSVFDHPDFNHI